MTCIAAVTDGKRITIGGDSAGVAGLSLTVRNDQKVFMRKGPCGVEWLFGFTTSFRMGQLIQYELRLPRLEARTHEDLFGFMIRQFIPALRSCLKKGGWASKDHERESGGTFIIGLEGKLFIVHGDYQVSEPRDPYVAVGCGEDLALGSLFSSVHDGDQRKRVALALSAAERFSGGVRAPFTIIENT